MGAEETILDHQVPAVFHRSVPGGEVAMPEEGHFFFERLRGLDHPFEPPAANFPELRSIAFLSLLSISAIPLDGRFITTGSGL